MGSENITPDELKSAKSYLKGMNIMSMESNSGQASQYAHYEIIGAGYNFVDRYDKKIDAVRAEDILRVGKKYLDLNYAMGGVIAK